MKRFLGHILKLSILVSVLLTLALWYVPDVVSESSILASLTRKHERLKVAGPGKIIFVGGSNLSFGLDSKTLSDSLHRPVVNVGLHAGLGLRYEISDVTPYIQPGDLVVLAPEYENFYTDNFYGEMELVSVLFSIDPAGKQWISSAQWRHLFKYMPTYAARKIKNYIPLLWRQHENQVVDVYHRDSFNAWGDACLHWELPNQDYMPASKVSENAQVNTDVLQFMRSFKTEAISKGADVLVMPPSIDSASFENQRVMIDAIEKALKKNEMDYPCDPVNYSFEKRYFFNSYYHLNKQGVDIRTSLLIHDLKLHMQNRKH